MRLNRFLSQCGLGSRRGCEQIILEGRVVINGHTIRELGTLVKPEDKITVDGRPIRSENPLVIALHKPKGYLCTRSDERERMTIYDLLPRQLQSLHHVGRLDKESEGLLLMTNRGDLSHHLIHPSKGAEKEYEVIVDQPLDQAVMAKLVKGMLTEEGHARAERAWMITEYRCHLVLKQGLKRQIRLMFYQLGFEVERLTRTRIGWLELKGLPKGGWKQLSEAEVQRFFTEAGTTGREKPAGTRKANKAPPSDDIDDSDEIPARSPRSRRGSGKEAAPERRRSGKPGGDKQRPSRPGRPDFEGKSEERQPRGPRDRKSPGGFAKKRGVRHPAEGRSFSRRPGAAFEEHSEERPSRSLGRSKRASSGPEARGRYERAVPDDDLPRPGSSRFKTRGGKSEGGRFSAKPARPAFRDGSKGPGKSGRQPVRRKGPAGR